MNNNKIIPFNKKKIPLELAKKGSSTFLHKDGRQFKIDISKGGIRVLNIKADKEGGDV